MGIKVDFVGLNTLIYDPIILADSGIEATASIGYALDVPARAYRNTSLATLAAADATVALNLHRNGPYGFSTFKQIRNVDKPIVSYYRRNSIFPYLAPGDSYTVATEPAVVFRNHPLEYDVNIVTTGAVNKKIEISYTNNLTYFANEQTNIDHDINASDFFSDQVYDKFKELYLDENAETFINSFNSLEYTRGVFPADKNNIGDLRNRPTYMSTFWRDSRDNRTRIDSDVIMDFDFTALTQSMWNLDAESTFTTNVSALIPANMTSSGPGVLQNYDTHVHGQTSAANIQIALHPRALYSLKQTLHNTSSVVGPNGISIPETGSTIAEGNLFGGNALWEAGSQAGYYNSSLVRDGRGTTTTFTFNSSSKNPFYDSYSDYADIIRFKAKGYSTVPEYKISDQFDVIRVSPHNLFEPENLFSLTGGISGKSESKDQDFYTTYSFSDLLGDEAIRILNDHNGYAIPSKLTLRAAGVLKLLPYEGFYPSERTVQIAEQFKEGFLNAASSSGTDYGAAANFRPILMPFYAPGIMYNTIKSGLAVDFPIFTGSYAITGAANNGPVEWMIVSGAVDGTATGFHDRVAFESILNPASHVGNLKFADMEPNPSASMDLTASFDPSQVDDAKYQAMIQNFCGEVPNFFLSNQNFTSISSKGDDEFRTIAGGRSYGMRVKLYRSMGGTTQHDVSPSEPQDRAQGYGKRYETFTMYSRPTAFGPAVFGKDGTPLNDSRGGYNFPFCPPYYNGEAWVDIVYTPASTVSTPTLEDIFSGSQTNYWRVATGSWNTGPGIQSKALVNENAMQISASINIFGSRLVSPVTLGGRVQPTSNATEWVIAPKFETPMMNFRDVSVTLPAIASESVPRGMWHQYGTMPTNDNTGVFLEVQDIPDDWATEEYGTTMDSLVDVVGFSSEKRRLGNVAEVKEIRESILLVPFIEKAGGGRDFISVERQRIDSAIGNITALYEAGDSVVTMVEAMQRYYIPPEFDFLNDNTIDPFVMYFMEFKHNLSKQDLADIWQNLPPRIGREFQEQEVVFEQEINTTELLGNVLTTSGEQNSLTMRNTLQKLRFMVVKVKQKAETSYGAKVFNGTRSFAASSVSDARMNWPYDFFSLVEYAKIDVGLKFSKANDQQSQDQSSTSGLPSKGTSVSVVSGEQSQTAGQATGAQDLGFAGRTRQVGQQTDTSSLTGTGYNSTTERQSSAGSQTTGGTSTTKNTTPGSGGRSR